MDIEAHWRLMIRQRRRGVRPFADPQTAQRFRDAVASRLRDADPAWLALSNTAIAGLANRLGLRAFEGRRWDARSVRGLRDAIGRERTARRDHAARSQIAEQESCDAELRRATTLLSAIAEHRDLDLIAAEWRYLSLVLMEDQRNEPAIRMVVRRAENYLVAKGHPEALLIRSIRDDP